jgi:asparagine synthase (glutamine-hydrolysing)
MPKISGVLCKGTGTQLVSEGIKHNAKNPHLIRFSNDHYSVHLALEPFNMESSQELISISPDRRAFFCGRLFRKQTGEAVTISHIDLDEITQTRGKSLGSLYWGRYILGIIGDEGITFYRDPQGFSLLYYAPHSGGYFFASDIATLSDALPAQPTLNWTYLTSFIASNHNVTSVTPFNDIYEMLPGCATTLKMHASPVVTQFWDPTEITSVFISDEDAFQNHVFDTARMTLLSWVSKSEKVSFELSGGLDSSSLLALLKQSTFASPVHAVNFFNSSFASSDEKDYAQDVCDLYNVPLSYLDSKDFLPFSEISLSRRHDRPSTGLLDTAITKHLVALLGIQKNDEIICGQGGDHLFLAPPPRDAFVDILLDKEFLQAPQTLRELCAYYRMPYVSFLRDACRSYVNYLRSNLSYVQLTQIDTEWMTDDFKSSVNSDIFRPFFWENLKKVHPGKAQHIQAILSSTLYIDRGEYIEGKPVINPLLSQPLVELVLSMPTYQSFRNGYNRFHYRKSLENHNIRGKFIWRTSKGETSGILTAGARKHFDKLRPMLLEGYFVQKGFVNHEKLNHALLAFRSGKTDALWPLINLFVAEKWMRSWERSV